MKRLTLIIANALSAVSVEGKTAKREPSYAKQLAHNSASLFLGLAAFLSLTPPASASLIVINSRSAFDALGSTVSVDWSVYGPDGAAISTPDAVTVGGLTIHVASSQGVLARHDEGTSFIGDFAVGAHLLTDGGSKSDSFIVGFDSQTVRGFGFQVEPHYIRGPFTGDIDVFGVGNVLLGDIPISGIATNAEDNSAPFYGIVSSTPDIRFFTITVNQASPLLPAGAVAINTMDVLVPVPEPATWAMLLAGLLGIGAMTRFARRNTTRIAGRSLDVA